MDIKEKMEKVNEKSLNIYACILSLKYILKDLDEMELQANKISEGYYMGLTNIVEQLAYKMEAEMKDIMILSE